MSATSTPSTELVGNASGYTGALGGIRICDFTGQLAGAGATKVLAIFGAQVIRVEDPATRGNWDILRLLPPQINGDVSGEGGGGFHNHNVEKFGITLNLRTERGKELLRELVRVSDAVTENFAAGVLERWGFGYDELKAIRDDIIYVSNCGFGHSGPYRSYKTWGPIVQAMSGLTFAAGLPDRPPSGWGYSYMDHTGAYFMAIALLAALYHRKRTGEGQWVDMSCVEAGTALNGPALLDATVNNRPLRRAGQPNSNRSSSPAMAPHGIYPAAEEDQWVAIACRGDDDWSALARVIGEPWAGDRALSSLAARLEREDDLDSSMAAWTRQRGRDTTVSIVRAAGVPCAPVRRPGERCDSDAENLAWNLFPTATHAKHGDVRVDGFPVHASRNDWKIRRGGFTLGQDNELIYTRLLGLSRSDLDELRDAGVI